MAEDDTAWAIYRRLIRYAAQYWPIFLLGVLGTFAASGIDAWLSWMIKPIVNHGLVARESWMVERLPIAVLCVFMVRGVAGFVSTYFISRVGRNVVMAFRQALFAQFLQLPATYFDQASSGHLLSMVIYDAEQVAIATTDAILTLLREGTLVLGLLVVMWLVNWQMTCLFLLSAPFIAGLIYLTSQRLRRVSQALQESMGEVTQVAEEGISAYQIIRVFGGSAYEQARFDAAAGQTRHRALKVVIVNALSSALVQIAIGVPIAVTLYFVLHAKSTVSAGAFIAVLVAMIRLLQPMRRLTKINVDIQKGIAGARSLFAMLDQPGEEDTGQHRLRRAKGQLDMQGLSFAYPGRDRPVLENVSFTVEPGQMVALVGPSGSGKSTLMKLLLRFYEPSAGRICLDGTQLGAYSLQDLRRQFAFVSQDIALFNDTIQANIAYGEMRDAKREAVIDAAKAAFAWSFIEALPQGLDSMIGEQGVLLSGGQRQRLAIARALLNRAPLLLLDEATSALDAESEQHVQAALANLMAQTTTVVIAHRLATIQRADKIIVLDQGRVVAEGNHAELLAAGGLYAEYCRLQFNHG